MEVPKVTQALTSSSVKPRPGQGSGQRAEPAQRWRARPEDRDVAPLSSSVQRWPHGLGGPRGGRPGPAQVQPGGTQLHSDRSGVVAVVLLPMHMHICRSEVLTTGRASSRGTPTTFILPPLVLRSRILAKCFCRHLRSWALQGLKLLLGWSPSSLSAVRPRWREVSTGKGQGAHQPNLPPAFFLEIHQAGAGEEQGAWGVG